jgi:hypothetical protein
VSAKILVIWFVMRGIDDHRHPRTPGLTTWMLMRVVSSASGAQNDTDPN